MYLLAKNLSSYTINPIYIELGSCYSRSADFRAEAEEFIALKAQLRILSNLEVNNTRLHLEYRIFVIYFLDFVDKGQPTIFVTVRLDKTWNYVKPAINTYNEEVISDRSNQRIYFQGNGVKALQDTRRSIRRSVNAVRRVLRKPYDLEDCEKLKLSVVCV